MPNINISLPQRYAEALETKAIKGESLGLAAKRLLLAILDGEIEPDATPTTPATDEIKELKEKIAALEGKLTRYILDDDSASGDSAGELAERIDDLALQIATIGESLNRTGPHGDQSVLVDRIIELEKKVEPIALSYQEKLPMAEASDRIAELEEVLGKMLEREFCGGIKAQVATVEELEKIRESITEQYTYFMKKFDTFEEQLDYVTDLPQRIETMGAVLDSFEEKLEDLSRETEQPKRRGRPRKEAQ